MHYITYWLTIILKIEKKHKFIRGKFSLRLKQPIMKNTFLKQFHIPEKVGGVAHKTCDIILATDSKRLIKMHFLVMFINVENRTNLIFFSEVLSENEATISQKYISKQFYIFYNY